MILGRSSQEDGSTSGGKGSSKGPNTGPVKRAKSRGWDDLSEIPFVVKEVCSRLAQKPDLENGPTEEVLYQEILMRLAKLQSSQDAHVLLSSILATPPELNLHVPKKPWRPLAQTQIWLYASDGSIHCICKSHHGFGLFRRSDPVNRSWIGLTASVYERINLTTGASVSRINLQVHEDKYSL